MISESDGAFRIPGFSFPVKAKICCEGLIQRPIRSRYPQKHGIQLAQKVERTPLPLPPESREAGKLTGGAAAEPESLLFSVL